MMIQQLPENDLEALLTEYQQARAFLRNYPHILDAILNQIAALQVAPQPRSLQEVRYEINRARTKPLTLKQSLAFYVEPVCPECGTALITDPTDADKLTCPECSDVVI